jgi:hypothetical protein
MKGDVLLFLPTRHLSPPTFGAFHVNCPGYYLEATGELCDMVNEKEWIIAAITKITEKAVDPKVCHPFSALYHF